MPLDLQLEETAPLTTNRPFARFHSAIVPLDGQLMISDEQEPTPVDPMNLRQPSSLAGFLERGRRDSNRRPSPGKVFEIGHGVPDESSELASRLPDVDRIRPNTTLL